MEIRSHSALLRGDDRVCRTQDHFTGRALVVFDRLYQVGEIVQAGGVELVGREGMATNTTFMRILGHTTWREARRMADAAGSRHRKLYRGHWHVVLCE